MLEDSQPRSSRGASGGDPEGGARCGVLRRRLATVAPGGRDPARQALRPGGEELAVTEPPAEAPAEVDDGEGSAGPGSPKSPRWSAGRRASRVWDARRLARRL